jgi:shikimate dehydrogenase
MNQITGNTRVVGIIADPVHHVRTPREINRLFQRRGVDAVMVAMHVTPSDLDAFVDGIRRMRNLEGLVVTVPHKASMALLCDELGPEASLVGAVNVVRRRPHGRLMGEVFDGLGMVEGLIRAGIDPERHATLLVGAGGAASAIAFALVRAGVPRLTVANRTSEKARDLVERLRAAFPGTSVEVGEPDPRGHSLVINGTSLGLQKGDALPLLVERLEEGNIVAEVIMQPARTPLLEAAAAAGCRVHEGRHMLDAQLDLLADFITGAAE